MPASRSRIPAAATRTFVRGHEGETDAPPRRRLVSAGRLDGTLVCFAGARQIGAIAEALLANGRPAEETAALIYDGTSAAQETIVRARSVTIAGRARDASPALLVVGAVVGLREHLRWFDERPLFGRRIVVTRSSEQAGELIDMLEERGAEAIPGTDDPDRAAGRCRRTRSRLRRGGDVRLDRLHERATPSSTSWSGCSPRATCAN